MLELKNITKVVGADTHIHPTNLVLERGSLNVLLGPTLSGKTSLMRLMAGLDRPTSGTIHFDGVDVTGMPVTSTPSKWIVPLVGRSSPAISRISDVLPDRVGPRSTF